MELKIEDILAGITNSNLPEYNYVLIALKALQKIEFEKDYQKMLKTAFILFLTNYIEEKYKNL